MNRHPFVLAAAWLASVQGAQAQTLLNALCPDPAATGPADLRALRGAALQGVSIAALDADGDWAVSADEIFAALADADFCARGVNAGRCASGDDIALAKAHGNLAGLWQAHSGLTIRTVRAVTAEDVAARPGLALEPWAPMLDERGRFVELRCTSVPAVGDADPANPAPPPGIVPVTPAARLRLGRFLLGKDVDSLTVQRGPADKAGALQKVAQAEIGLESDLEARTRTVSIHGVAGLRLIDNAAITIIPFVEYIRSDLRDRNAGTDTSTGKLGLGAVATTFFGGNQVDFAPRYARDLASRSELLSARLSWRPGFLYALRSFRDAFFFACGKRGGLDGCAAGDGGGVAIWTDFQLVGSFGTVLRTGADPTLTDGRDFVRVGPAGSVHLYGQSGVVRDLSLNLSYKRLFRITGDGTAIGSFKADVNYWIAGSRHVSLLYGYERSQDEETLARIDLWKLGFGVRF